MRDSRTFSLKCAAVFVLLSLAAGASPEAGPPPLRAVGWTDQSIGGPTLNDVAFVDSMEGFVVGAGGALSRTLDATSWAPQTSGTANALNGIAFATGDLGCAVGDTHTLIRTTNGKAGAGSTWVGMVSGDLFGVAGSGGANGWAVGAAGSLRRTSDSGATWPVGDPNNIGNVRAVSFVSATEGYSVGDSGRVRRTTDGTAWVLPNVAGTVGVASNLFGIAMVPGTTSPNTVGWAVGANGTIRKTINSGSTWGDQSSGGAGQTWNAACVVDLNNAWAVGTGGQIVHTDNGGTNWMTQNSGVGGAALNGVSFKDNMGSLAGVAVGAAGNAIYSTDGGQTWMPGTSGTAAALRSVFMISPTIAVAVGDGGVILKSTDGGQNWNVQGSGLTTDNLLGVAFGSATVGWAVGANGIILTSSDAGDNWAVTAGGTNQNLRDIHWASDTVGLAVGAAGEILKTVDGGAIWRRKTNGTNNWTTQALNGVAFGHSSRALAVGGNGVLLKTENAGDSWATVGSGTTNPFFAVAALSETLWVAVGGPAGSGTVVTVSFDTTSSTWSAAPPLIVGTAPLRGVSFPRFSAMGYAVTDMGAVFVTTDAGDTWNPHNPATGSAENLRAVAFPCHGAGWVVGTTGTILRRDDPPPLLSFPPHVGTPHTYQPPLMDGFVNPELTETRRPDTGWDRALRVTYGDGTTEPNLSFQGLRHNAGNYLFLSFEVRNDTSFDDDETIVILFRDNNPGGVRPEHTAGDRRIIIRPLSTGSGSPAGPVIAPGYVAPSYPNNENGAPRTLDLYKWNTGSNSWQSIASSPEVKVLVRSYPPASGNFCWSVEVQVPITSAVFSEWINIQPNFLFSFYVLRKESGGVTEFSWPRDLFLSGPADVFLASMPACDWGTAKLGTAADGVGVHIKTPQYTNVGANTTGNPSDPLTSSINGTSTNTFVARVRNDSTVDAPQVRATFRIADWGVQSGDPMSGAWRLVRADTGYSNPPATQTIPASDERPFTFNWTLNSTENADYAPPHEHQCVQVSLDSLSNVLFTERSYWKNMDYVPASTFQRKAFVSAKGLGRYGARNGAQRFFLHVVSSKYDFDPGKVPLDVVPPPGGKQTARVEGQETHPYYEGENLKRLRLLEHFPGLKSEKGPVSHYTWETHAVRETSGTVNIGGKIYPLLQPLGGFGYVARHGNPVDEWTSGLTGAEVTKLTEWVYQVDVPVNKSVLLDTSLEAKEGGCGRGGGPLGLVLGIGLFLLIIFWFLKKKP